MNGIEPSSSAWKAVALPLSYTRKDQRLYRIRGFRPVIARQAGSLDPAIARERRLQADTPLWFPTGG